jgi:hypothetical protein
MISLLVLACPAWPAVSKYGRAVLAVTGAVYKKLSRAKFRGEALSPENPI